MKYKILVLDIDGTLTNSEKKITPATKEALLKIQSNGIKVVIASGRPTPGTIRYASELEFDKYGSFILSYNGAKITNFATKEIIYQRTLPHTLIPALYKKAVELNCGIITYENDCIIAGTAIDKYIEIESRINNIPIKCTDDFASCIDFDVNKCIVTNDGDILAEAEKDFAEEFGDRLSIYRSEAYFLEIMPKNVDKAASLSELLKRLGINKDEMICCGDGFNDISMIKYAGLGVAMSNAQQAVKEAADYITASNDEDGIVQVIEKFMPYALN